MNLSIREIAKELGISPRTVYRYVEEHRSFLDVMREGKRLLVSKESLPTLKVITDCYRQGMTAGQVQVELARLNVPMVVTASDGQMAVASTTGDVLALVLSEVRELCRQRGAESQERSLLLELLRQQTQEVALLREELVEMRKGLEPAEIVPEPPAVIVATPRRRSFWDLFRGSKGSKGDAATGT